jgi:hypothetical protein
VLGQQRRAELREHTTSRLVDEPSAHSNIVVWDSARRASTIATTLYEHAFVGEWRTDAGRSEAHRAGLVASSEFPSPLRRRNAAGPAIVFLIGADLPRA